MYYTVAQLRQIEQAAKAQGMALMPLAGRAAANFIAGRFGKAAHVLVLVGPGNNGGDALVAATLLRQLGYGVTTLMPSDPAKLPADAAAAYAAWRAGGGREITTLPAQPYTVVIDGLFGIGLNRPLAADWQALIMAINALEKPVLALDVPSGIDADQGAAMGNAIQANWTLSFIGQARGLGTGAARDAVGETLLDTLSLPIALRPRGAVVSTAHAIADVRLARPLDSHKGRFGTVLVVGGAAGMVGAALLAGRAALHSGAGKVLLSLLDANGPSVDFGQPELMLHTADPALLAQADTLLLGPGLGQQPAAETLLSAALQQHTPLVLDADALNLIAQSADLQQRVAARSAATILTPHPSEAARLLQWDTAAVQAQRFTVAQTLSAQFNATVVLKGAGTLVAEADRSAVNHSGSAALANAGQGDVLGGVIAALLAQGLSAWQAANLAVLAHGLASDELLAASPCLSTPASAIIQQLGKTLARWRG